MFKLQKIAPALIVFQKECIITSIEFMYHLCIYYDAVHWKKKFPILHLRRRRNHDSLVSTFWHDMRWAICQTKWQETELPAKQRSHDIKWVLLPNSCHKKRLRYMLWQDTWLPSLSIVFHELRRALCYDIERFLKSTLCYDKRRALCSNKNKYFMRISR